MREIVTETQAELLKKITVELTVLDVAIIRSVLGKCSSSYIAEIVEDNFGEYAGELVRDDRDPTYALYVSAGFIANKYIPEEVSE